MAESLRAWLSNELNRRKLSQRELARQAGISQAFVNKVLSGDAPASVNFCHKVAKALDVPPESVLRLAGILPPTGPASSDDPPVLQELVELARLLSPEQQEEALRFIRFLGSK